MSWEHTGRALAVEGLTASEKLVLVAITHFARRDKGQSLWHSQSRIADELGMNKKTVREAYKKLEDRGLITRQARAADKVSGKNHRTTDMIRVNVGRMTRPALDEKRGDNPGDNTPIGGGELPPREGDTPPGWGQDAPQGGGEVTPLNQELNQEKTMHSAPGPFDGPAPVDMWNACHGENDDPWTGQPRLSA